VVYVRIPDFVKLHQVSISLASEPVVLWRVAVN
jgi:hypothetical protein